MSVDIYHAQVLAQGWLPAVKAVLYTAPASKRVIIKTMTFVNTDVSNRVINAYVKHGTSRNITPFNLILGPGYKTEEDNPHTLFDGDTIEGDCDAATKVSYVLEGAISQ